VLLSIDNAKSWVVLSPLNNLWINEMYFRDGICEILDGTTIYYTFDFNNWMTVYPDSENLAAYIFADRMFAESNNLNYITKENHSWKKCNLPRKPLIPICDDNNILFAKTYPIYTNFVYFSSDSGVNWKQ